MGMDPVIRVLDDIWIMRREGTVLFHRVADEKVDQQLLGSFMSAIEAFARRIDQAGVSSFHMGPKTYAMRKEQELYFLASCAPNAKLKKAQDALVCLSDFFLSTYKLELHDFKGDVRPFRNFEEKLRDSMDFHWILT